MKGEGRPRNKPYWIIGIFLLPVIAMAVYMLNYDYSKSHLDRQAAEKYGWSVGDGTTHPGRGNPGERAGVGGMLSFSVTLDQKQVSVKSDGSVELSGEIVMSNRAPNSAVYLDLPLQNQSLWSARISPLGSGLGEQISGFPLQEMPLKSMPASAYKPASEPLYTELQGWREVRTHFFCVVPAGALAPGSYRIVFSYLGSTYAQNQKLMVAQPDKYSQPLDFEVQAATGPKKSDNVPPVHSPE